MTARSLIMTRTSLSGGTFTAQTWEVGFVTDVTFTSFVCDILAADTYTLTIDGNVVATVTATAGQTGVTFTPTAPIDLIAGTHTFVLAGTASRTYYFKSGIGDDTTGDSSYGIWGLWAESTANTPAGRINFTEATGLLTAGMQRSSSTGTARSAMTWDVTFDVAISFVRMLWLPFAANTYKLQIDGVDVASGVAGTVGRFAKFQPSSPVALSAGTHTFKIVQPGSSGDYYRNTATPLIGSAHVTTWAVWSEAAGTTRVAGLMAFIDGAAPPQALSGAWGWVG